MPLTNLQRLTAEHIFEVLTKKKEKKIKPAKYLLADEVGLGKTKVAADIIKKLAEKKPSGKNNDLFVVYYICGNERITSQNIRKLTEDCNGIETENKRFSMQWEYIQRYIPKYKRNNQMSKICILPITPATTFTNIGSEHEQKEESSQDRFFNKFKIKNSNDFLLNRRIIVEYTYKCLLKPDLILLDEFQNYSKLLYESKNEDDVIKKGREIFIDCMNKADYVLMLSATPYEMKPTEVRALTAKPFNDNTGLTDSAASTNQEDQDDTSLMCSPEDEGDSPAKINANFKRLVEFILGPSVDDRNMDLENDCFIYNNVLCRSERGMWYKDLNKENEVLEIPHINNDEYIIDYERQQLQYTKTLYEKYREWTFMSNLTQFISLTKECPEIAMFSTRYSKLKGNVKDSEFYNKYKGTDLFHEGDDVCTSHYGMHIIHEATIGKKENNLYQLLWIPPTIFTPADEYQNDDNPFWVNKEYTKTILFGNYRLSTAAPAYFLSREIFKLRSDFINQNKAYITPVDNIALDDSIWMPKALEIKLENPDIERAVLALKCLLTQYLCGNIALIRAVTNEEDAKTAIGKYAKMGDLCHVIDEYALLCGLYDEPISKKKIDNLVYQFVGMSDYFAYNKATKVIVFDDATSNVKQVESLFESTNKKTNDQNNDNESDFKKIFQRSCGFCERFTDDNTDCNAHIKSHQATLQGLFNSPFYPFVMSTTSVAQEGLDFHNYCHQIVHWSVAKTPMAFEQREGRIDRYMSHLIRKRLQVKMRKKILEENKHEDIKALTWTDIMDRAEKDKCNEKPLFPYWYVEPESDSPKFKRIVCAMPNSAEGTHYAKLRTALSEYNYYLGPSREEEKEKAHSYCPFDYSEDPSQ